MNGVESQSTSSSLSSLPLSALTPAERTYRWFEYFSLFFLMPGIFALRNSDTVHIPLIAILWTGFAICLVLLLRDRTFDRSNLWRAGVVFRNIPGILALYVLAAAVLTVIVQVYLPEYYLKFPTERPGRWLAVMFLYPILSVWPQQVIFRSFLFHRYEPLFSSTSGIIMASALAFCWGHIVFQNWIALALTLPGGIIFAITYARTRSGLLASIEHALYGCLVFTLGFGSSLYYAAVQR